VFSVQFDGDVIDEVAALSRFWPKIQPQFPNLKKQPPFPPATEDFGVPGPQSGPQVQFLTGPPSHRYWFLSEDGTKLIQVQGDRFLFNWRQVVGDEEYPRFATLFPEFIGHLRTFLGTLDSSATPAWCELSYINPVPTTGEQLGTHGQLAQILNYLVRDPERQVLPVVEDAQLQQRFRILDERTGEPTGRLYVTAVPGFRNSDSLPVYVITLLARGRAEHGELPESLVAFFDRAHDLIVGGFREVTTPAMHELWGLRRS
jgi:uncharacterized protein (TIGR04255 family)